MIIGPCGIEIGMTRLIFLISRAAIQGSSAVCYVGCSI
jgi:hypothetical protein